MEVWKDVLGFEGFYQVSNKGNVISLNYRKTNKLHLIKQSLTNKGYLRVVLSKNGYHKRMLVHRLVALHFVNGSEEGLVVNHIDENKQNNISLNLEWVTSKENANYGNRNKKISIAKKGKKISEETKEKISLSKKGQPSNRKGVPHSEETKKKISNGNKGKQISVETRKKISIGGKGKKMPIGICPYCGIECSVGILGRFHNEKCKSKIYHHS